MILIAFNEVLNESHMLYILNDTFGSRINFGAIYKIAHKNLCAIVVSTAGTTEYNWKNEYNESKEIIQDEQCNEFFGRINIIVIFCFVILKNYYDCTCANCDCN